MTTGCLKNKLQKLEDALIKHMLTADDLIDRGDMGDSSDMCGIGDSPMVRGVTWLTWVTRVTGVTGVIWVTWLT